MANSPDDVVEKDALSPDSAAPVTWGQIQVEMTSRCNLRCATCLYPAYENQWIARDLSDDIFQQIVEMADRFDSIHLQGWGETLLRDDTPRRVADVTRAGGRPTISCNGTIMNADLARQLVKAGLHSMTFSLADADAQNHDALRGTGSFATAMESIRIFAAQRSAADTCQLLVNYLLTPASIPKLPRALALCNRLGVKTLVTTHLVHACTPAQQDLVAYGTGRAYTWSLFRSRLAVLWRRTTLVLPGAKPSPMPVCIKNPLQNLFVAADGAVSPCVYLCPPIQGAYTRPVNGKIQSQRRLVMGNLKNESLEEIWQSETYVAFRETFQRRTKRYEAIMPPVRTDFEGLARLERSTDKIRDLFATPDLQPPEACRGCPHLLGY